MPCTPPSKARRKRSRQNEAIWAFGYLVNEPAPQPLQITKSLSDVMEKQVVLVKRDIEVITIPYGTKMTLYAGSQVIVAQGFGGSYTVLTDQGMMVRVEAKDADAIGETPTVP